MDKLRFNVIGAGRLGKNLAISLINTGQASLGAIVNQQFAHAKQACLSLKEGQAIINLTNLPPANLIFITTPDDKIAEIALKLAKEKVILPGSIVVHCSGVLSSEVLKPLQMQGCFIASFHPLKAFRTDLLDPESFKQCDCVVEGDKEAIVLLTSLFKSLGAHLISIHPDKKAIYHAGAVFAANHLVTLAAKAIQLFTEAGINEQKAKTITTRLMQTSLANIQSTTELPAALTGPLVRGDIATIAKHINALKHLESLSLYKLLSLQSLPLTSLSETQKSQLIKMLKE